MAVERLGAGNDGQLAHLVHSNRSNDAVGGYAGSAGGDGIGARLERAALGYGDAVSAFGFSEKRVRLCCGWERCLHCCCASDNACGDREVFHVELS